jgi:hypothetical protein
MAPGRYRSRRRTAACPNVTCFDLERIAGKHHPNRLCSSPIAFRQGKEQARAGQRDSPFTDQLHCLKPCYLSFR